MTVKILVFAGSIRKGSHNVKLASALTRALEAKNVEVEHLDLTDYPLPILNQDIAVPENAHLLAKKFSEHDGLVIASPEYNSSLTPLLKNVLDWVSLTKTPEGETYGPYAEKFCFLAACSPGGTGGIRGLYHLRSVLMNVGAEIITPQLGVGNAMSSFDDNGDLIDERYISMMNKGLDTLIHSIKCHQSH